MGHLLCLRHMNEKSGSCSFLGQFVKRMSFASTERAFRSRVEQLVHDIRASISRFELRFDCLRSFSDMFDLEIPRSKGFSDMFELNIEVRTIARALEPSEHMDERTFRGWDRFQSRRGIS
jgi:hypothetical protein